ncbi:MAG TPA: exonuclease domain-containing protein [Ktedonobacterales bacterium]
MKKSTLRSAPIRVSIDLETTGLQAETDNIIEIAAVKFRGDEVMGQFQTFVATNRPIPYRVQRLTGITSADLQNAPHFDAVAPALRAFLGKAPLVGHSVPFDAAFLRRRGLAQDNPLIDTFELATVLLPALPSYSLERVAEALGVQSDVFHRAMADAVLAKDVLLALLARIGQLELSVLEELSLLRGRLSWPLLSLFADERRLRSAGRISAGSGASVGEQWAAKLGLNPQVFALGIARPASAASGLPQPPASDAAPEVARIEMTRQQQAIDAALAGAFARTQPLLLEIEPDAASLHASLLSAMRWAQENDSPLVIAAANAAACRRLMQETLPGLQANLPRMPRVEFLVEPEKYLCLHRWFGGGRLPRNGHLPADITRGLAKLTLWLHYSASGIRDELVLMPQEQAAWELVRSGPAYLEDLANCRYAQHGYCFFTRARDAAASADVLVTTHAALLAYLSTDAAVLAKASHLLVLDAHLLEDEALRFDGYELNRPGTARLLDDLLSASGEDGSSGLLVLATRLLEQAQAAARTSLPAEARLAWWHGPVSEAKQALERFFNALALLLSEHQAQHHGGGPRSWSEGVEPSLRLQPKIRNTPAWKGVEQAWDELEKALLPLLSHLERLVTLLGGPVPADDHERPAQSRKAARLSTLADLQPAPSDEAAALAGELKGICFRLHDWAEQGRLAITQPRGGMVYWVRPPPPPPPPRAASGITTPPPADAPPATPTLHAAPILAGPLLQRTVFRADRAAALVSSVLTVNGDFDYMAERLGLAAGRAAALSVAPEQQPQSLLYLPEDVAEPNTHHYQKNLDAMLIQLATALNGETVALFASHAALRAGYAGVKAALEEHGILVLAQGIDGSIRQIWQTFRSQERVVLLAAVNTWDTVDLPGERPACVVVTRLPFPALSDPPLAGRAEVYHDQLHQFVIPQASLRLRQALNRLSWSGAGARATNGSESVGTRFPQAPAAAGAGARRNAIVLFDKRVLAKDYGPVILSSMPHCTVRQGSVSVLPEQVAGWIRGESLE